MCVEPKGTNSDKENGDDNDDNFAEDDDVIVDNREIMLIRCSVIELGRSWIS